MKYLEARNRIQSGDVISFTHIPWSSWYDLKIQTVRLFTRSEYSHSAIAWVVGDRVFLLEAVSAGVRIFPLSRAGDFFWTPRGVWSESKLSLALDEVGDGYSQLEAIKGFFGMSSYMNDAWQCAEFVCYVLDLPIEEKIPSGVVNYLMSVENLPNYFVSNT